MSETINNIDPFEEKIKNLLIETAEAEGFQNYTIEKGNGSMKGDGYLGIIKTAKIRAKDNDKILNLVVKSASKSDALRNHSAIGDIFEREIYMYNTVFTTFKAFEEEKGLPPCNFMPKFYNFLLEDRCETLILENLKEAGYKLYKRRIPMNQDHVRLVLTEYGRLHALSFALRDQDLEKFEEIIGGMDDRFVRGVLRSGFIKNFVLQCKKAQEALDKNKDKEVLDVYKEFIDTIPAFLENLPQLVDEYSVALHGDCWTNNMMFKYEDEANPKKPTKVSFFDYQLSRLGSPALDLLYFFYTCCPKEIINDLDCYLQLYYESFSNYLKKLGSDPDKMFPYSVLQRHWKKYAKYGLMMSVLIIHIMLTEKEEAVDFSDKWEAGEGIATAFDYEIKKVDAYNERIRPIILHFVERKLI
ncbi:hypothetical protein ILUMI_01585 [Ignelater luminosus]|uniref:CHK kinase-like domain-containing protein n=1 Tax=Ignelater luminosus TaxID=2038154 RepID=A0A8K0GK43_IGNLU|nr:hypothetical protein ILUMI_01585 [Ignelater luminosus]